MKHKILGRKTLLATYAPIVNKRGYVNLFLWLPLYFILDKRAHNIVRILAVVQKISIGSNTRKNRLTHQWREKKGRRGLEHWVLLQRVT